MATACALAAVVFSTQVSAQKKKYVYRIMKGPYLQNVLPDGITIMWETNKPGGSIVEYGETMDYGMKEVDNEDKTIHEVTLRGLKRETLYHYKVTTGDVSGIGTFRTAIKRETPFSFAVWGDNRTDFMTHTQVAMAIAGANPDIAVNVGDVVTDGNKYEQWGREYFIPIRSFARNVPTYIAIGNHERNAEWYYKFVSQPGNEAWYSFDYGNAHFTVFDSNRDYTPGSEQYRWLVKDLGSENARNAAWRFVFKHHPEYSEGWDKPGYEGEPLMRRFIMPLYGKNKVDVVFSGHTHDYERGLKDGVYHVITGGGGAGLDTFQKDFEHVTVYKSVHQFCRVEIAGKKLRFEAVDINGSLIDSFEIRK
ncbi:MAG: metallophosphoesterase family protein [bacterium]